MSPFDKRYNALIRKYMIADVYPDYYNYLDALEISERKYDEISDYDFIIITTIEDDRDWLSVNLGWDNVVLFDELDFNNITKDIHILIASLHNNYNLRYQLQMKGYYNIQSLYDCFEEKNIYLSEPFYTFLKQKLFSFRNHVKSDTYKDYDPHMDFFYLKKVYENDSDFNVKKSCLKKMICIAALFHDFVTLEHYIARYKEHDFEGLKCYEDFLSESKDILDELKHSIQIRNKKDVFMFWLDQVEYDDVGLLSYVTSLESKSVVLDNIYTMTPFTGATLKLLFSKKRLIEDKAYSSDKISRNSPIIKGLEERNYEFLYYGKVKYTKYFDRSNVGKMFVGTYAPLSEIVWNCIIHDLECTEKSVFNVIHSVTHTHNPYSSFDLKTAEYINFEGWAEYDETFFTKVEEQKEDSYNYTDKQMEFWLQLLPEETYKIIMSDHGHSSFGKFHPFMMIMQKDLRPRHYNELLSYYDFDDVIFDLMEYGEIRKELLENEYVQIQDTNYRYKNYILNLMEQDNFNPSELFGYQGVVTKNEIFQKTFDGRRLYYKKDNSKIRVSEERFEYLDKLIGKEIPDNEEEAFRYSRLFVEAEKRNKLRNKAVIDKQLEIIRNIFRRVPENEELFIRCGGLNTYHLLLQVGDCERNKVKYIVDNDKECLASKLGFDVIFPREVDLYNPKYILISTFAYRTEIRNELETYLDSAEIIDLYDEFEKNGIFCGRLYYERQYERTDFMS